MSESTERTYMEAIGLALREALVDDPSICLLDMPIHRHASNLQLTRALVSEFGPERFIDTTLLDTAQLDLAIGLTLMGLRPIITLASPAHLARVADALINRAGRLFWRSSGELPVPLVVRVPYTTGGSESWDDIKIASWIATIPGLKVVIPATPYDARGLLTAAIQDPNPTIFLEDTYLYQRLREPLEDGDDGMTIGVAESRHLGDDLTILTWGSMLYPVLEAAESLEAIGINADVIDLRSLAPLDKESIYESVEHTSRLLIAAPCAQQSAIAATIAATIAEDMIDQLDAPILRVGEAEKIFTIAQQLRAM
jgi:pyruvate/2-oxoglutarate/acetoin dehydrogenase E1 component